MPCPLVSPAAITWKELVFKLHFFTDGDTKPETDWLISQICGLVSVSTTKCKRFQHAWTSNSSFIKGECFLQGVHVQT